MRERGVITSPAPIPAPRSPRTDAERGRRRPIAPQGAQRPRGPPRQATAPSQR